MKESSSHKEWKAMRRHAKSQARSSQRQQQKKDSPRKKFKFKTLKDFQENEH